MTRLGPLKRRTFQLRVEQLLALIPYPLSSVLVSITLLYYINFEYPLGGGVVVVVLLAGGCCSHC